MTSRTDPKLLQRITDFPLSDTAADITFASKLADDNGWTLGHAALVEQEYRRFLYLSQVAGHEVCPSDDVDQAWHLHLTQTHSYQEFCLNVLGKFLHHRESKGGSQELHKHQKMYAATLASYRQILGSAPPPAAWPSVKQRFRLEKSSPSEARWQLPFGFKPGMAATIGLALLALAGAAFWVLVWHAPIFPNMAGPSFLKLYVCALIVVAAVFGLLWHGQTSGITQTRALDAFEAAWLCGGIQRVFATALASLVKRGLLDISWQGTMSRGARTQCRRTDAVVDVGELHPVERICLDAMPWKTVDTSTITTIARGKLELPADASDKLRTLQRRLENANLIFPQGQCSALLGTAALLLSALLTVAMARFIHGIGELRPVGFLAFAMLINTVMIALCLRPAATTTAWGRKLVADLKLAHAPLKDTTDRTSTLFALGFAIFGVQSVSADPRFDGFRRVVANPSDGGGGGCSGGGGCGGGGCGGGGCGG